MEDSSAAVDGSTQEPDEVVEDEDLRPGRVDDRIAGIPSRPNTDRGDVVDVDRLEAVRPVPRDGEDRGSAEGPSRDC
jgi:hypothetical protein